MCAHKGGHVPHGTIPVLKKFGHLAGWATLYCIGVSLALAELLDRPIGWLGLVYVTLCAHAGYLFDRVKYRDRDLDPADLMADHDRHTYLRTHAPRIRVIMTFEWICAMIVGAIISPVLGLLVIGGIVAGFVYSGWPPAAAGGQTRLKDIFGLKALMVSGAVVGLGVATVLAGSQSSGGPDANPGLGELAWVVLGMGLVVFGDAVICDLDDRVSDRAYGIKSVPVLFGMGSAGVAGVLMLGIGCGILVRSAGGFPEYPAILFGGFVVSSGVVVLLAGPRIGGRRDWIDGRMLLASALLFLGQ